MKPTVGRIVHYTSLGDRDGRYPSEIHAALITKVALRRELGADPAQRNLEDDYFVSLHVFYEDGEFNMKDASFTTQRAGTEAARGQWSWPAKETS